MAMVLIPGFMLDADLWRDVEPALAPWGPLTHAVATQGDTLAEMAGAILRDAPPRFVLIGFSMGGYIAREIHRQAPERVTALILIATSARGDDAVQARRKASLAASGAGQMATGQTTAQTTAGQMTEGQATAGRAMTEQVMTGQAASAAFRGLSRAAIASSLHPDNAGRSDLVERIQAMGQRLGGAVFRRQSLLDRHDERDALATVACPTLIIAGDDDRLRSRAEALELHEGITGSDFAVIEHTGHMVPMEAPQQLATLVTDWLQRTVPADAITG